MFLTQFGASIGKCVYFLVADESVFALTYFDAIRCPELEFVPYSLLVKEEQDRVWDCYKNVDLVLI